MNGATALDCEKTISRPNNTKTTTMGTSQYFFSCLRNCQNSENTRFLLMMTSIHPVVVLWDAISRGIRRPARPAATTPRQRIPPGQTPDDRDRHEHDREQDRQQDARVDVTQRLRESPPHGTG